MLENLSIEKPIRSCRVRTSHEELEGKDKDLFMQYINDTDSWPSHTLAKALAARGLVIDPKAIQRHRESQCTCRFLNAG